VASNKRTDVATQTAQNAKVEGAGVPDTDKTATRLEEILESMQVNPPADVGPADEVGDDSQSSGGYPAFMQLPMHAHSVTRLGQAMVDRGLITQDDLDRALEHQRVTRKRLGESLIDIGAVTSFQLSQALADHLGVPFIDLETHPPDVLLAGMIPEDGARRYCALPVERWSGQGVVAMATPNDVFARRHPRADGQSILLRLPTPATSWPPSSARTRGRT
jgi:hypothetical protein